MPFLVDSVMGEILERGHVVHMVSHPILHVRRSESGRIEALFESGEDDRDAHKESYIHVHIARIEEAAERQELEETLSEILDDVGTVVADWRPMVERIKHAVSVYTNSPPPVPVADLAESIQFLKWLVDNNFTFLGQRLLSFEGGAEQGDLVPVDESGLGILRDEDVRVLRRGTSLVHMTPEIRKFFLAPAPLIVAKANVRSRVHRRAYMDYIGIKTFTEDGEISGELRVVGLFTSGAYTSSVRKIPFLRHKTELVMRRSGYPENGHSGKALMNVLETFPRDELFQIDARMLYDVAMGIQKLELHPRARAFSRIDEFDRFVSIIVYVPRDRYSTEVRARICNFLAETYHGPRFRLLPLLPGRAIGAHSRHHRPLRRRNARPRPGLPRGRNRKDHPNLGGRPDRCHSREVRRHRRASAAPQIWQGLSRRLPGGLPAEPRAGRHRADGATGIRYADYPRFL